MQGLVAVQRLEFCDLCLCIVMQLLTSSSHGGNHKFSVPNNEKSKKDSVLFTVYV